ncbi:hypothetical protein ALP50_05163 [Pseudomonas syringae pv. spinaceae]|uniref:Uncharacterized protein n=1 Tax=Pseudomonas syringae pv. spinaceae TaxID=264459 RepID=A0A0Q0BYQ9_PSESX|nr:hypothetical protein [Pseudomonas syringae]KPY95201.1 hypothetical protein ALO94_04814 [Pseudomonas syringae pv. spinaceae]RMT30017.1 hypothetical protein ALP50_05163 [Pseudomonas syringae pv. spinaceae]
MTFKLEFLPSGLVYRVEDDRVAVTSVAVGKRERGAIYDSAKDRLSP